MTAHRCCPGCGTELTTDGGTTCGCVGPFTAEHVDPMHIRPYVDLPEPVDEGTPAPDLEPFAQCGTGETAELPAVLPPEQSAAQGHPGASRGGSHRRAKGRAAAVRAGRDRPDGHPGHPGRDGHPGHDGDRADGRGRRRPGTAVLAAAGVVVALGAGLLTTQALTSGDSGDDRSLSTDDHAAPEMPSGGPTERPSRTEGHKRDSHAPARLSRSAAPVTPRADRDSDAHTERNAVSPSASSSAAPHRSGSAGDTGGDEGGDRYPHHSQRPPERSTQPSGPTLRPGDSGAEVAELQRRLKQAGALAQDAPEDGVYSSAVQQAVGRYQSGQYVQGDDYGEYGPNTRRALESQTTG